MLLGQDLYSRSNIKANTMEPLLEKSITCPYCGETIDVLVDISDQDQQYIEDCQVCCRPITFVITMINSGDLSVSVRSEDDVY